MGKITLLNGKVSSSADFDLTVGTTDVITLEAGGYVGIGTTNPAYALDIYRNGADAYLRIHEDAGTHAAGIRFRQGTADYIISANGTEMVFNAQDSGDNFRFQTTGATNHLVLKGSSGNVGIGTSNPSEVLHVYNSQNTGTSIRLENPNAGTGAIAQLSMVADHGASYILNHADARTVTRYSSIAVGGYFEMLAQNATNGLLVGTGTANTNIIFGNNSIARMIIIPDGNVGIGTTAPSNKFHIYTNDTGTNAKLRVENDGTGNAAISFKLTGGVGYSIGINNADSDKFTISNNADSVGSQQLLTILNSTGYVGIGTTNPSSKLQINGTVAEPSTGVINHLALTNQYNGFGLSNNDLDLFAYGNFRFHTYQATGTLLQDVLTIASTSYIGIGNASPLSKLHIKGHVSESHSGSLFRVEGSSGSLFEVIDSLEGSLLSVNDISGLPILEVFSDDRVVMGTFNQNTLVVTGSKVGIGTSTPAYQLEIVPSGMNNIHFSILDEVSNASFQVRGDGFGNAELDMWDGASNNDIHLDTGGVSWFNGGNVGIGTTNPTTKLDVSGSITISETTAQLLLPLSNDATTPTLAFGDGNTGFYESADNQLRCAVGGGARFLVTTGDIQQGATNRW
jgi:hypothetical protein